MYGYLFYDRREKKNEFDDIKLTVRKFIANFYLESLTQKKGRKKSTSLFTFTRFPSRKCREWYENMIMTLNILCTHL